MPIETEPVGEKRSAPVREEGARPLVQTARKMHFDAAAVRVELVHGSPHFGQRAAEGFHTGAMRPGVAPVDGTARIGHQAVEARVPGAHARPREEALAFWRAARAQGIAQKPEISRLLHERAVPVKHEGARPVQFVRKDAHRVGATVACDVLQNQQPVPAGNRGVAAAQHSEPARGVPVQLQRVAQFGKLVAARKKPDLQTGLHLEAVLRRGCALNGQGSREFRRGPGRLAVFPVRTSRRGRFLAGEPPDLLLEEVKVFFEGALFRSTGRSARQGGAVKGIPEGVLVSNGFEQGLERRQFRSLSACEGFKQGACKEAVRLRGGQTGGALKRIGGPAPAGGQQGRALRVGGQKFFAQAAGVHKGSVCLSGHGFDGFRIKFAQRVEARAFWRIAGLLDGKRTEEKYSGRGFSGAPGGLEFLDEFFQVGLESGHTCLAAQCFVGAKKDEEGVGLGASEQLFAQLRTRGGAREIAGQGEAA